MKFGTSAQNALTTLMRGFSVIAAPAVITMNNLRNKLIDARIEQIRQKNEKINCFMQLTKGDCYSYEEADHDIKCHERAIIKMVLMKRPDQLSDYIDNRILKRYASNVLRVIFYSIFGVIAALYFFLCLVFSSNIDKRLDYILLWMTKIEKFKLK